MKKLYILLLSMVVAFVCLTIFNDNAFAEKQPDPSGINTGNATEIVQAKPGETTINDVANQAGHNKVAINLMWTLITGFLVMFMQAGFAMVEGGLTRGL